MRGLCVISWRESVSVEGIVVSMERLIILLVDENQQRSDAVAASLRDHGYQHIVQIAVDDDLLVHVQREQPDVVLMDIDSPGRDTLEQVARVNREQPRPVVMFTLKEDRETVEAAIRAGVSAYIVNDLAGAKVRPIIDVAIARFRDYQGVRDELQKTRTTLEDRKLIERAKGIIMHEKQCPEPEAYRLLQKQAMDQKRRLADVARELIHYHEMMKRA